MYVYEKRNMRIKLIKLNINIIQIIFIRVQNLRCSRIHEFNFNYKKIVL